MSAAPIRVGDVLWFVPVERRDAEHEVTVAKVGRKWITDHLNRRFDPVTMRGEPTGFGRGYHGTYWRSREEWEAKKALDIRWSELRQRFRDFGSITKPAHVTLNTIRQVETLLWPDTPPAEPEPREAEP